MRQNRKAFLLISMIVLSGLVFLASSVSAVPGYKIVEEENTSHSAANRITFWVQLLSECSKDEMRQVIVDVTDKYKRKYDIIWLKIVPKDAKPAASGFKGWRPIYANTKWISRTLDEQWHTTIAGPTTGDEQVKGIVINWSEQADTKVPAGEQEPVKAKPIAPKPVETNPKTFQEPSDFPKGSAERTLAEFVAAWKAEDWERMAQHCQLHWLANNEDATGLLKANFGFLTLYEFRIIDIVSGPMCNEVTFSIRALMHDMPNMEKREIRKARIIKEIVPGKPSESGTWGVNPTSAIGSTPVVVDDQKQ